MRIHILSLMILIAAVASFNSHAEKKKGKKGSHCYFALTEEGDELRRPFQKVKELWSRAKLDFSSPRFSPDGKKAFIGQSSGNVLVVDLSEEAQEALVWNLPGSSAVKDVQVSSTGDHVAVRKSNGQLFVVNGKTGEVITETGERQIVRENFRFSPDGQRLAYAVKEAGLFIAEFHAGGVYHKHYPTLKENVEPRWSEDGKYVFVTSLPRGGGRPIDVVQVNAFEQGLEATRFAVVPAGSQFIFEPESGELQWVTLNGELIRFRSGTGMTTEKLAHKKGSPFYHPSNSFLTHPSWVSVMVWTPTGDVRWMTDSGSGFPKVFGWVEDLGGLEWGQPLLEGAQIAAVVDTKGQGLRLKLYDFFSSQWIMDLDWENHLLPELDLDHQKMLVTRFDEEREEFVVELWERGGETPPQQAPKEKP